MASGRQVTYLRLASAAAVAALLFAAAPWNVPAVIDATASADAFDEWIPLGDDLAPPSVGAPSLAVSPRREPVVSFETPDGVSVLRWNGQAWIALGSPLAGTSGPSVGLDEQRRIYECYSGKYAGTGAPNVRRWNGSNWRPIGGNIADEAGYEGQKHVVDACGGIALDRDGTPTVTWTAEVGAKSWAVYAAQWSPTDRRWFGLGSDPLAGGRAVTTYIDVDRRGRPHIATSSTTGYGAGRLTIAKAWRWDGVEWLQLGPDMPGLQDPIVGAYELAVYMVGRDDSGMVTVMRWRGDSWQVLPSPGPCAADLGRAALDFTPSGEPVVAYLDSLDAGLTIDIHVKTLKGDHWESVGAPVAHISCDLPECYPRAYVDLGLDDGGRPVVAWTEHMFELGPDGTIWVPVTRLHVKRQLGSLR